MASRIRMLAFWLAVGGLSSMACSNRRMADPTLTEAAGAHVRLASLRRTACFGSCPVFLAEVWGDGRVTWQGERHVVRVGSYTAQVSATWIAELLREAEQRGFFDLSAHYPTNGRLVPDLPQTITMLRRKDREYQVTDNADAPPGLWRFERYVQEKLDELVWVPVAQ